MKRTIQRRYNWAALDAYEAALAEGERELERAKRFKAHCKEMGWGDLWKTRMEEALRKVRLSFKRSNRAHRQLEPYLYE